MSAVITPPAVSIPSDKDNIVDGRFVQLSVAHGFFNRLECALEQVATQLLETGSRDRRVEIDALTQRVDLDVSLRTGRQCALTALTSSAQPTQRTLIALDVLLMLPLELVDKMVYHSVVEVLTTQVSVARC